ncbi:hypothetical protein Bca52824_010097 [Brassica carinata]|uniref:Uncharacterized protein n=1 Tax=Brassica carinata TaxID=52824 RepID=A0A8X8B7E5_BRACI|nr:hypothetical protein Bca52824_010097 [Brassica carinata]
MVTGIVIQGSSHQIVLHTTRAYLWTMMTGSGSTFMRILNPTVDSGETYMLSNEQNLTIMNQHLQGACYETVSLGPGSNNVLEIHGQCRHSPHPFGADCESITSVLFLATGTLALSSMSTFNFQYLMRQHVHIHRLYSVNYNPEIAKKVNAWEVAKADDNWKNLCLYQARISQGRELTRKHASEMVDKYFEVQGESFWIQLKGRIQAITAMKVVSPSVLHPLTFQLEFHLP